MENTYIVGDLVKLYGKVRKVIGTYKDDVMLEKANNLSDSNNVVVKEAVLSGVELTSEILEKNGWEKDNYYNGDYTLGDLHIDSGRFLHIGDYDRTLITDPIKYIHQLQHLFFGLGIDTEIKM
mgnify:CR=1 FL=1